MKAALVDFLHPEDKADEVTPVVEEVAAPVAAAKPASFALSTKKSEVDIDEEFNELFNIK